MEETKKRKGYKNIEDQVAANKRYEERHPEIKEKNKISRLRSTCKRFIREYATEDDVRELEILLAKRRGDFT